MSLGRIRVGSSSNPIRRHLTDSFYRKVGENKYFHQRENDVLMVNIENGGLITTHNDNILAEKEDDWGDKFEQITKDVFETTIREVILEMGIYKYCK